MHLLKFLATFIGLSQAVPTNHLSTHPKWKRFGNLFNSYFDLVLGNDHTEKPTNEFLTRLNSLTPKSAQDYGEEFHPSFSLQKRHGGTFDGIADLFFGRHHTDSYEGPEKRQAD